MTLWSCLVFAAYGCATSAPAPKQKIEVLQGIASWYGQEFAGRTTANGEIFDPMLLTAAHRTLPFGTVVDVRNPKTNQSVRVRINDRGPYVGQRVIDLSYAAAQQIGLIEPGSGTVDLTIVRVGNGDREPPAPYEVTVAEPQEKIRVAASDPPPVAFPLPTETRKPVPTPATTPTPAPTEAVVDSVAVIEEHAGVATRRQVAADGTTVESVPVNVNGAPVPVPAAPGHSPAAQLDRQRVPPPPVTRRSRGFVVQVGAFSVEANARALQERLTRIGQRAQIDAKESLFRVRIGPFTTRELALQARTTLEANGISAIVMPE